jgi:3D (Asp-Asp-Asp) domain-containing protein
LRSSLYTALVAVAALILPTASGTPALAAFDIQPGSSSTIQPGQSAVVTGTEGRGLRVRAGPAISHKIVTTANEGTTVQVVAGPVNDGGDDWYQLSIGTATASTPTIVGWGIGKYLAPSGTVKAMSNAEGRRTFLAKITAYADGIGGVPMGARTYSGTRTRWGVVAVDPKVIPIGSSLLIEGYDDVTFVAEDVGGGIKGEAIDIWLPDPKEARSYGTQYRRVTIVREGPAR